MEALEAQQKSHVFFGRVAYEMGLITLDQVMQILELQRKKSMHFGEVAIELGILDASQVACVLAQQQDSHVPLGQLLATLGMLDPETLDRELKLFLESKAASPPAADPTSESAESE